MVNNENIVRKTQFPRIVIPLSVVTTGLFNLCLNLLVVLVFITATGVGPRLTWLALPLIVAVLAIMTTGVSLLLSALFVRFRDVFQIWGLAVLVLFYASPVLWPVEVPRGEDELQFLFFVNPFVPLLEEARHLLVDPDGAVGRRRRGERVRDHRAGADRDLCLRDRAVDVRARRAPGRGGAVKLLRRRGRAGRRTRSVEPLSLPGTLPFDDRAFESRLAWIFGSPRTGSTWLLRLLTFPLRLTTKRPSGSIMPRRASVQPLAVPVDEPYLPSHLTPVTNGFAEPGGPSFLLKETRADDPNYFFADAFAECWRPEVRRLILVRLHAQAELAAREHSLHDPLVVIKEPNGSHGADFVMSILSRSRMIFQLRDGRDVIDSILHAQSGGGWLEGRGAFGRSSSETRAAGLRAPALPAVGESNPGRAAGLRRAPARAPDGHPVRGPSRGHDGERCGRSSTGSAPSAATRSSKRPSPRSPSRPIRPGRRARRSRSGPRRRACGART